MDTVGYIDQLYRSYRVASLRRDKPEIKRLANLIDDMRLRFAQKPTQN